MIRALAFALALLASGAAHAAFVQAVQGALSGSGQTTSQSATGSAIGTGNTIVGGVIFDYYLGASSVSSITDNASGNTYTILDTKSDTSTTNTIVTFVAINITGGPTTITANFSGAGAAFNQVFWNEYSSISALDVHAINFQASVGTGTDAATSGNVTTTAANDTIAGFTYDSQGTGGRTVSAGTGFTRRSFDGVVGDWDTTTEDLTQSSAGSIAATFTVGTAGDDWITSIIALKPTGAAAATPMRTLIGVGQ